MGQYSLLLVVGAFFISGLMLFNANRSAMGADEEVWEHQHRMLARDVATTGMGRAVHTLAEHLGEDWSNVATTLTTYTDQPYQHGTYTLEATSGQCAMLSPESQQQIISEYWPNGGYQGARDLIEIRATGASGREGAEQHHQVATCYLQAGAGGALDSYVDEFSVFVLEDAHIARSQIEGSIAVGGDVSTLTSYSINAGRANRGGDYTDTDALVVGGDVEFQNGSIWGNLVYGGSATTDQSGTVAGELVHDPNRLDFAGRAEALRGFTDELAGRDPTGTVTREPWGEVRFEGINPELNIFSVSSSTFSGNSNYIINVPDGSTVVINVTGTGVVNVDGSVDPVDFQYAGVSVNDSRGREAGRKVIFNFPEVTELNVTGIQVLGSIIAPRTALTFNNGQVNGQIVARTWTGTGTPNLVPFNGSISAGKQIIRLARTEWTSPVLAD